MVNEHMGEKCSYASLAGSADVCVLKPKKRIGPLVPRVGERRLVTMVIV